MGMQGNELVNGNKKEFLQNFFDPKMALLVGQRWSEKIGKISTPVSCSTLIYHVALFCRALLYVCTVSVRHFVPESNNKQSDRKTNLPVNKLLFRRFVLVEEATLWGRP